MSVPDSLRPVFCATLPLVLTTVFFWGFRYRTIGPLFEVALGCFACAAVVAVLVQIRLRSGELTSSLDITEKVKVLFGAFRRALILWIVGAAVAGLSFHAIALGVNGTFRDESKIYVVSGSVVGMSNGGKSGPTMRVWDEVHKREQIFGVGNEAYNRIKIGDSFREEFYIGLFGWPCRPR